MYVCPMKLEAAKAEFIQSWGTLGSSWGINRTMSQIHALLMISPDALSTEDIMKELNISRGNANTNIRMLMDWGLVQKQLVPGERKEFFYGGKDIWEISKKIIEERSRREIQPILESLKNLKNLEEKTTEANTFVKVVSDLEDYTMKVQNMLQKFIKSDRTWFFKSLIDFLGK